LESSATMRSGVVICALVVNGASAFNRVFPRRPSDLQPRHQPRHYAREDQQDNVISSTSTSTSATLESLQWRPEGTLSWEYEGHKINFVAEGLDKPGTPLVLIHGFGASAFHWRYNVPALAEERPVYALDLLGFGLSDKPLVSYSAEVWRDQVGKFIEEVVGTKAVVAGNSLGGFSALYCAAEYPKLVSGCVMLNGAGRFRPEDPEEAKAAEALRATVAAAGQEEQESLGDKVKAILTKGVIYGSFFVTKQPARIEQVLRQVYPIDPSNVDPELVESIRFPADTSPNCAEVFYRVITKNGSGPAAFIDDLLPKLTAAQIPLSLVWGEYDPWIRPAAADKIQRLKPDTTRVSINAGHCPHDEAPVAVNAALSGFMAEIDA